jgi:hypothetical protein
MGFQPCTLWQSPYAQDGKVSDATGGYSEGALKGYWEGTGSDIVKKIRSNLSPLPLPAHTSSVVWKLEQFGSGRTMCQAKGMSG